MNHLKRQFPVIIGILASILLLAIMAPKLCMAAQEYKVETREIKEKKKEYTISIKYPHISGHPNEASQKLFNKVLEKYVQKSKGSFLASFKRAKKDGGIRIPWNLAMVYDVRFKSGNLISILMTAGYFEGGAHPNPAIDTYVFDLKNSKQVKSKDLFKPGSKYLEKISKYCIGDLMKRKEITDEKWVKEGAAPKPANYRYFCLTKKGLVILFAQYQVAPYAYGVQEVTIPYKYLKDIINPAGAKGLIK